LADARCSGDTGQYTFGTIALPDEPTLSADASQDLSFVDPQELSTRPRLAEISPFDEDWYSVATRDMTKNVATGEHNTPNLPHTGTIPAQLNVNSERCTALTPTTSPMEGSLPQLSHEKDNTRDGRMQRVRHAEHMQYPIAKAPQSNDCKGQDVDSGHTQRGQYREMNRLAAKKSRAKRKCQEEDLEIRFGRESARHKHLSSQLLALRDMLTFLRESSLQHGSSSCDCKDLREYNSRQARRLARSFSNSSDASSS